MPLRVPSLRFWLLVAMITSATVGLVAAVLLFRHIEHANEHVADAAKARRQAETIARQVRDGAGPRHLAALQQLLVSDQITVVRAGKVLFAGPRPQGGRDYELQATTRFPGGLVRVADYTTPGSGTTLDVALITGGLLVLVIGAAILAATLVTRAVRVPVQRAIDAAERVSQGDFSARMGTSGPEELVKLGSAFDEMAERLERADRDQRQFLADVAHEIATPINAVSGFALALADGAAEQEQDRREARGVIEAQSARLGDLLRDLRKLTQLDLTEEVRVRPVALREFGERLLAGFRPAARAADIDLRLTASRREVMTDPRLLEMIVSNLISNAIRYTPAGGIVRVGLGSRGDEVLLRVRDTGVGISPEHQKRIFERLYRVDNTRTRATGGSGLGLAIVRRAVQTLGGRIELDSTPGQGSEFRVILPAHPPPRPAPPPRGE
ncbi:MAG TPA: HAMP domain-containing sensor histidine kinase [Solirubrobacteraceae bacterium]|nr:HAMP domain-containing sensor histidine kinase [Solirubrobacteraceae bacterium]